MDKRQTPPPISHTNPHFVDIHEVLQEEDEEDDDALPKVALAQAEAVERRVKKPNRLRPPPPRQQRSFGRQVSLETGLDRDGKGKGIERMALPRSGRSFGGFDSTIEGRKADFSIFRTKSTLSKQNSLLPSRKLDQRDQMESQKTHGSSEGNNDESVNKSVPVGRYFAALRGPELDQVKV